MAYIETPPILSGEEAQKLEQMYRYLQRMAEQVQDCLNGITVDNFVPEQQKQISQIIQSGATQQQMTEQKDTLKSIIIKTANIIRSEQEEIRTQLTSRYQALSDQFGDYERELTNNITATAEGIIQEYQFVERIQALDEDAAGLKEYQTRTSQYMKTGIVDTDDQGRPIIGVEVGTAMDTDSPQRCARFTSDRMSFFQNNTEVAYMSNQKLFIGESEVLRSMKMGGYVWRILSDNSMGLAWEG